MCDSHDLTTQIHALETTIDKLNKRLDTHDHQDLAKAIVLLTGAVEKLSRPAAPLHRPKVWDLPHGRRDARYVHLK